MSQQKNVDVMYSPTLSILVFVYVLVFSIVLVFVFDFSHAIASILYENWQVVGFNIWIFPSLCLAMWYLCLQICNADSNGLIIMVSFSFDVWKLKVSIVWQQMPHWIYRCTVAAAMCHWWSERILYSHYTRQRVSLRLPRGKVGLGNVLSAISGNLLHFLIFVDRLEISGDAYYPTSSCIKFSLI